MILAVRTVKRQYDGSSRRAASVQTRQRILDEALDRFVEVGYRGTTIAAVAQRAGVSVATVYELVGRKPAILRELMEQAISGSDHAVAALDRDYVKAIAAEPGAANKLAIYAAAVTDIQQRMSPLFLALRDASSTDADAHMLPSYDYLLEDDSVIAVGNLGLRTIATPGHTPGSICFRVENKPLLFSGDTLFPGGAGATSFGDDKLTAIASFETIIESIDRKLFTLDRDTLVMPGHGTDTTIGTERPHLDEWIDRGW